MEMILAITKKNHYFAFLNKDNNPCMFMSAKIKIPHRSKLRKVKIENEPIYIINKPEQVMHKIVDIMKKS